MNKQFNPEKMHKLDNEARRKLIPPKIVLDLMNIHENETLIDVGAGTGYFAIPALDYVGDTGKVVAVDISEAMLAEINRKIAPGKNNFETVLCDATTIPLPDKIADKILLAFIFHEFEDKQQYLTEIARLLKDSGTITIVEWDMHESKMGPSIDHRISCQEIVDIAEKVGLVIYGQKTQINEHQYLCTIKKK